MNAGAPARLLLAAWLAAVASLSAPGAPEEPAAAGGAARYLGRELARPIGPGGGAWLLRESREREERPDLLLAELRRSAGLGPGLVVCDLGAGVGFHALRLARLVEPSGSVLAEDIQPEMLETLRGRAAEAGAANVTTILGTEADPRLPEGGVDLVVLVDVYHEFSKPSEMLAGIRKGLRGPSEGRPAGRVALVEFRAEDPDLPISPLHKMTSEQIRKEWEANGFEIVSTYEGLPRQHLVILRARVSPPEKKGALVAGRPS